MIVCQENSLKNIISFKMLRLEYTQYPPKAFAFFGDINHVFQ
jgi:hypothetical protein